ncbi:glycosyltransferase [Microbacterium sp. H1-D42]|uniref:glycosyltransferase n=1 Tax=Microbacterium sp. H1-D42 TaxID=2925844 RepID=UPI001F5356CE|nr:glycosyltransferase [Microbacterium sp. H1-D42]UNK72501.1 glycosyltransferase [Microbacterium sp. H1-D42]
MLFSTTGNQGHFGPLVSLARAAAEAGHDVRVAAPASFAGTVQAASLRHVPFADAPPELIGPIMVTVPALPFDEANAVVIREVFGRVDAQAAYPGLVSVIDEWGPDLVVREPAEVGSLAAAESAGLPHVQVAIGMAEMARLFADHLAGPLAELSRGAGLAEAALTAALAAEPVLSSVPEPLDLAGDDAYDPAGVAFRYRDELGATPPQPLPRWGDPALPLVYVTFGSVTGSLPPFAGVFRQALDGLADLPVRVLMTVGHRVDIAGLGAVPPHARVEAWWPQADVLSQAALVLGHGGFGTTMGALSAGVPQVVAPIFTTDQVINARHVAAIGAGRDVEPGADAVIRACREVMAVLGDPAYREVAESVAAAIDALPSVEQAVRFLESATR